MPPKPLIECKVRGCRELTRDGYCHAHADGKQQEAKYYNNHVRDKQSTSFSTCFNARQLPLSKLFKARSCRSCCHGSSHSGAKTGLEQTIRFK